MQRVQVTSHRTVSDQDSVPQEETASVESWAQLEQRAFLKSETSKKIRTEDWKDVIVETAKLTSTIDESRDPMASYFIVRTEDLANISGVCSVSMAKANDELDIADELSAISMMEEDQRQILEELENLKNLIFLWRGEDTGIRFAL